MIKKTNWKMAKGLFAKFFFGFFLILTLSSDVYADIDNIISTGTLNVAVYSQDAFPFFFHDNSGQFTGFDVDIAKEIAKDLGVKLVFNRDAATFDSLTDMLVSGKVDLVISWFSRTLERAKKIQFSKAYFIDRQSLLINRLKIAQLFKKGQILNELDNDNVIVGTIYGTVYAGFLSKLLPNSKIQFYKNWDQCSKDVYTGKIVAGLLPGVVISSLLNSSPEAGIIVKKLKLPLKDYICIGVNPVINTQLYYWINIFLTSKNYHFTADELIKKYTGKAK